MDENDEKLEVGKLKIYIGLIYLNVFYFNVLIDKNF